MCSVATMDIDLTDGQWHQVRFVRDTTGGKLYAFVDDRMTNWAPDVTTGSLENNEPLIIGGQYGFAGCLEELRIAKTGLTVSDTERIFNWHSLEPTREGTLVCDVVDKPPTRDGYLDDPSWRNTRKLIFVNSSVQIKFP